MIDDICESDTLIHDMCPRDCDCLSNNFQAPFFSCDCKQDSQNILLHPVSEQCSLMLQSLEINFDDAIYFSSGLSEFEYPMLPSFTKINVQNDATKFNKFTGLEFNTPSAHLNLNPTEEFLEAESACFWNIDNCVNGFVQHMTISVDHIDESKFSQKVLIFVNGHGDKSGSKFIGYIQSNRLHFSIYEMDKNVEWLVSSPVLTSGNYVSRPLKVKTFSYDLIDLKNFFCHLPRLY